MPSTGIIKFRDVRGVSYAEMRQEYHGCRHQYKGRYDCYNYRCHDTHLRILIWLKEESAGNRSVSGIDFLVIFLKTGILGLELRYRMFHKAHHVRNLHRA